jgi:hypoxanthine phosphoribosyltransferase
VAVRFPLAVDVRGQSVLIIDDVTDTGDTLRVSEEPASEEIGTRLKKNDTNWLWMIAPSVRSWTI